MSCCWRRPSHHEADEKRFDARAKQRAVSPLARTPPPLTHAPQASQTPPFLERGHATTLAALGKTYIGGGRYTEARHALARADRLKPDDAGTLYHLGSACFRNGRRDDAKAALEAAQTVRPGGRGHAPAAALLEKMAAPSKARKKAS